jgi:hypothetical protein
MRITKQHSRRLSLVGGVLLGFGTLVAIGDAMTQLMVWQMGTKGADHAQMAALLDRFDNSSGASLFFGPGGIAFLTGSVVLSVALWRTPAVPRWAAVLFGTALVVQVAGFTASDVAVIAASNVASLVSMAMLARTVGSRRPLGTADNSPLDDGVSAGVRS